MGTDTGRTGTRTGTDRRPTAVDGPGGHALRLGLVGDLDLATARSWTDRIERAARTGRPLELDASGVVFLDCHGLGVLLRARARWPGLLVVAPSPAVEAVLHLTGRRDLLEP